MPLSGSQRIAAFRDHDSKTPFDRTVILGRARGPLLRLLRARTGDNRLSTSRADRQHEFRPTTDGHAVILDSVRQGPLDSGAPVGWQEITVFSTVGFHPHEHPPGFAKVCAQDRS